MKRQIAIIEWVDSGGQDGWIRKEDANFESIRIITIGFIVHQDEENITIVHSESDYQFMGLLTIPKYCIKNIKIRKK